MEFSKSFEEASPSTPIFFILSPGVNPLKDVETLGKQLGFTMDLGNFHNVSLGQGQESIAEAAMEIAAKNGHWVVLQNIHLVRKWLPSLEKQLEHYAEGSHEDYRMFLSAEPASTPSAHIIPQVSKYINIHINRSFFFMLYFLLLHSMKGYSGVFHQNHQ